MSHSPLGSFLEGRVILLFESRIAKWIVSLSQIKSNFAGRWVVLSHQVPPISKSKCVTDKYLAAMSQETTTQIHVATPQEVIESTYKIGIAKSQLPLPKLILLGMLAGIYISVGGLFSTLVGYGMPVLAEGNPILPKLLSGLTFPLGLILVQLVGAELFTGNNATLIPAVLSRQISWLSVLRNWGVVYCSNLAGALLFVYVLIYSVGLFTAEPWHSAIMGIAEHKVHLSWGNAFLRGIGANWLVCLAVWLGFAARTPLARMVGLALPVTAFVVMGYEHSIANMFYIPLGILEGADVSIQDFFVANLIPVTLGNILGGALFVGSLYTYIYGKR